MRVYYWWPSCPLPFGADLRELDDSPRAFDWGNAVAGHRPPAVFVSATHDEMVNRVVPDLSDVETRFFEDNDEADADAADGYYNPRHTWSSHGGVRHYSLFVQSEERRLAHDASYYALHIQVLRNRTVGHLGSVLGHGFPLIQTSMTIDSTDELRVNLSQLQKSLFLTPKGGLGGRFNVQPYVAAIRTEFPGLVCTARVVVRNEDRAIPVYSFGPPPSAVLRGAYPSGFMVYAWPIWEGSTRRIHFEPAEGRTPQEALGFTTRRTVLDRLTDDDLLDVSPAEEEPSE